MNKSAARLVFAFLALLLARAPSVAEQQRHLLVKSGERMQDLGDGSRLAYPIGITHDREGNVIAADTGNGRVVKLSPEGKVLLAFGRPGEGPGELRLPADVAVDRGGNFYVADTINNRVSKFSPNGKFVKSWGKAGEINGPHGITVGPDNSVYLADTLAHRIAKYTADGKLIKRWGKEGGGRDGLRFPHGITTDQAGNVYVTDFLNHRVVKYTADGGFVKSWGKLGSKPGEFHHPWGIEIDSKGSLWVTDMSNNRLQRISPNGEVSVAGRYANTQKLTQASRVVAAEEYALVDNAKDATVLESVAFAATAGAKVPAGTMMVFVGNSGGYSIDKLVIDAGRTRMVDVPEARRASAAKNLDLTVANRVTRLKGGGAAGAKAAAGAGELGALRYPIAAKARGQNTYVTDTGNHRIVILGPDGAVLRSWGGLGSGRGQLNLPSDLAVDSQGNVYVADTMNDRVQKFSPRGEILGLMGGKTETRGPHGIAVGPDNMVYVADTLGHRIVKYDPQGKLVKAWGQQGAGEGQLRFPHGLAVAGGFLYVADFLNHRIVKFTSDGKFVAAWGQFGTNPGEFRHPWGVSIGPDGDVWIGDMTNSRLQRFTADGGIVGVFGAHGNGLGQFDHPKGVDVRGTGEIVVGIPGLHAVDYLRDGTVATRSKPEPRVAKPGDPQQ